MSSTIAPGHWLVNNGTGKYCQLHISFDKTVKNKEEFTKEINLLIPWVHLT